MYLSYDLCLFICLLSNIYINVKSASTKDWLIEFHRPTEPEVARTIAKRYAMVSRGPVGTLYSRVYDTREIQIFASF